jgi:predicted N-acetyltransferase YhbS
VITIRLFQPADIAAVDEIGNAHYPANYYESRHAFESKINGYAEGCFVAEYAGEVVGYIIAVPWRKGISLHLNSVYSPPENPDCLYIHDICVKQQWREKGIAQKLVNAVFTLNTWRDICLTAVLNSAGFWRQFGFEPIAQIEYCDAPAVYMQLQR